ncbi:TPA: hypothetical protein ACK2XL_000470 [Klebsiella oxytoca]|uniref:hypothetical protein n=1 Tax=Klebsiella oxytoca TaxID=571 RepID=UPI00388FDFBC|nr:hypothetical protein [Klebsiella oxytoca]HCC6329134.1 hypothetical protein [Klebsiella oxytoca]
MKISLLAFIFITLTGCVDPGLIGIHPELRTSYFNGYKNEVASCLQSAAVNNDLLMQQDDSLPDGSYRYNILDAGGNTVAWVDIADFSGKQSTVSFYYACHNKDMYEAISSIIAQCKRVS